MQVLPDAYIAYKKLKEKYPDKFIVIKDSDISMTGTHLAFKDHREYVAHKFRQEGIEVYRWAHDYESLSGNHPQLGVVYLANDSVLEEALEAHVLIGHNARYIQDA